MKKIKKFMGDNNFWFTITFEGFETVALYALISNPIAKVLCVLIGLGLMISQLILNVRKKDIH
jgi:hypothetical protein